MHSTIFIIQRFMTEVDVFFVECLLPVQLNLSQFLRIIGWVKSRYASFGFNRAAATEKS